MCMCALSPKTSLQAGSETRKQVMELDVITKWLRGHEQRTVGVGTSMVVQWLKFPASNTRGMSSIPGWRSKTPHTMQLKKNVGVN